VFIPVLGSLLYLFMNVIRRSDLENAQGNLVQTFNPTKKIRDLEKKVKFSETFENKVALADEYLKQGGYANAIEYYELSLKDTFANDYYVLTKLQEAHYLNDDVEKSLAVAEKIKDNKAFRKSRANLLYALALDKKGDYATAEEQFRLFDARYNYYEERLALARFLIRRNKQIDAKEVLQGLINESENMSKQSFRTNKFFIRQAKEELNNLN